MFVVQFDALCCAARRGIAAGCIRINVTLASTQSAPVNAVGGEK